MVEPGTHFNKSVPLSEYVDNKINMLKNEFYLKLTDDEVDHLNCLKSEYEVDAYAHKLLIEKL